MGPRPRKRNSAAPLHAAGTRHFNAGRFSQARRCFRAAAATGEEGPETRVFLGHAADSLGLRAEAIEAFTSAISGFPRQLSAYSGLATVLLRKNPARDRAAERTLLRVLKLKPGDGVSREDLVAAWLGCGRALRAVGALNESRRALRQASRAAPRDGRARRELEKTLALRERAKRTRRTIALRDKAEKSRLLREELKALGGAFSPSERARRAESILARLMRLDARDARACSLAGGVLFSSGKTARARALLRRALRMDECALSPGEKFAALIKLGRYREAVRRAELTLDGTPTVDDLRAFWNPWGWDAEATKARRGALEAFQRAVAPSPWVLYYRADLHGSSQTRDLEKLAAFPARRYGWMLVKGGLSALCDGRFSEAAPLLRRALGYKTADWRTRCLLAETLLCLRRRDEAFAQMDRALAEAPPDEAGQVVAWRGLFDLWLGRYGPAARRLDQALRLGAPYALTWKAGALLKLGRAREALELLDLALERDPRDLEAYVWRGEAKRALGRPREALKDLEHPELKSRGLGAPDWLWARVNRALAKAALGDHPGAQAEFDAIPARVLKYIRSRTGPADMEKLLQAGLELSRGFRREEYRQALWMI